MINLRIATLLMVAFAACGTSSSNGDGSMNNQPLPDLTVLPDLTTPPDLTFEPTAQFVGTWSYGVGGTLDTNCPGQKPSTDISANMFVVTRKSKTELTFGAGTTLGCSFDFTVAGDTATINSGQMCTVMYMGANVTIAPDSGMMITHDGMTGSLVAHTKVFGGLCMATLNGPAIRKM